MRGAPIVIAACTVSSRAIRDHGSQPGCHFLVSVNGCQCRSMECLLDRDMAYSGRASFDNCSASGVQHGVTDA